MSLEKFRREQNYKTSNTLLKKKKINIEGPISADTAFIDYKKIDKFEI